METQPNTLLTVNFGELAAQTPPTLSPDAAALALQATTELMADWVPDGENHAIGVRFGDEPN